MCEKFSFIDFNDCCQVYLDFISTSVSGIRHIASISDQGDDLNSIASTIDHSIENFKKLFEKYLELAKKESDSNGK